jgi:SAM-dependent methyltransferase
MSGGTAGPSGPPGPPHPLATFGAEWLRVREVADRAARDAAAASMALDWRALAGPAVRVLDLGCGTGATLRWLAPRLGGEQVWHLVDHDEALLQAVPPAMAAWARPAGGRVRGPDAPSGFTGALRIEGPRFAAKVHRHRLDLARQPGELPIGRGDWICATALLDLVSAAWLAQLIGRARDAQASLCFALTVDGRIGWSPAAEDDALVAALFARHQQRDKGFGPALGPSAAAAARRLLAEAGYIVIGDAPSDWQLDGVPWLADLVNGIADAALDADTTASERITRWREWRLRAAPHTRLRVGHVDLVARPR